MRAAVRKNAASALRRPQSDAERVATLLDLPAHATDLSLVAAIERGLPVSAANAIVSSLDPAGETLQVTALVPKATYHRAKKLRQPLSRDLSERLLAFARVAAEALRLYGGDTAKTLAFLRSEHSMLGGRSPMDLAITSTAGADLVLKLMWRADAGVAV